MRDRLGDGYAETLRQVYPDVPETVDFVMYWWHKAAELIHAEGVKRFGFITTNSIRQPRLHSVINFHFSKNNPLRLLFAVPDHPWTDGEAAVRISMTVAGKDDSKIQPIIQVGIVISENNAENPEEEADQIKIVWKNTGKIFSNLQTGVNLNDAKALRSNSALSCQGVKLHGQGFLLNEIEALQIESRVIYPFITGRGLVKNSVVC
jgi:hypothetical protein